MSNDKISGPVTGLTSDGGVQFHLPNGQNQPAIFNGDVEAHALADSSGPGKIIWPDGTEVSAEQFQDSVTAATIAYDKGLAAGRKAALLDAAEEQERLSTGPRALGSKAVRFKRLLFANWLRERAEEGPTSDETPCPCVTPDTVEWRATRWWRAVAPDGTLWLESSNEREVRERARPGDTIQRLYETVPQPEWRNA